jgi:hypothetical protein
MIVRMWEVRAEPRSFAALLNWVCEVAVPTVESSPLHISSEIFSSADFRLVVITKWNGDPEEFQEPPPHLVARPPHSWDFFPVDR